MKKAVILSITILFLILYFASRRFNWFEGSIRPPKIDSHIEKPDISNSLSKAEQNVLAAIDFDENIALELKDIFPGEFNNSEVKRFSYDFEAKKFNVVHQLNNGITFKLDADTYFLYNRLSTINFQKFKEKGYLLFGSSVNKDSNVDEITILKSDDQFDILRAMQTNWQEHKLSNNDIIQQMQEWHDRYPFEIKTAGSNWVEAHLIKKPDDPLLFANEIAAFCPNVITYGTGSIESLAQVLNRTGLLYLFWD